MKLGIKIAPGNAWKHDIEATRPQMVEIWYNAARPADYTQIFAYLKDKPIDVGLHYWGALKDGILTNTSYPDLRVCVPSIALMYATVDAAKEHNCAYVNVHPDLYSLLHVDFATMDIRVASEQANRTTMRNVFLRNMRALHEYARACGVVLTVETVPQRDTPSWRPDRDRSRVIDIHQMSPEVLVDLAAGGVNIANDICHTACNKISSRRDKIWAYTMRTTQILAAQTRLIHLGFLAPPYNGVDFHDSLDNPILETPAAVPNKKEMAELLKLFRNRDDIWILVEPKDNHPKNYFLARGILENAGVLTK